MRLQSGPLSFVVNFLLGVAWAAVLLGAITSFLSFYGHLDPPSVVLEPCDCVWRGDKVGDIGRPRTPPHLHFEIRTHLPVSTDGGYWSTDPTEAGWLPPSQTIWETRLAVSPGVAWTRSQRGGTTQVIGWQDESTFVLLSGVQLLGVDLATGKTVWNQPLPETNRALLVDSAAGQLYALSYTGVITAYDLVALQSAGVGSRDEFSIEPIWAVELDLRTQHTLLPNPHPEGGVLVYGGGRLVSLTALGDIRWQVDELPSLAQWVKFGDQLILMTRLPEADIWSVGSEGVQPWGLTLTGRLIAGVGQVYVYAADGIYTLDVAEQRVSELFKLPEVDLSYRDAVALPTGELLFQHRDRHDQRLLAISIARCFCSSHTGWTRVAPSGNGQARSQDRNLSSCAPSPTTRTSTLATRIGGPGSIASSIVAACAPV